jgi:hypothetical protein
MTTTLTAIPMKMTASARRFLECVMAAAYSRSGASLIDPDQVQQILRPVNLGVKVAER